MGGAGCVLIEKLNIADSSHSSSLLQGELNMPRCNDFDIAGIVAGHADQSAPSVNHYAVCV